MPLLDMPFDWPTNFPPVENLRTEYIGDNQWRISWDPVTAFWGTEVVYSVRYDGSSYGNITSKTTMTIDGSPISTPIIQVGILPQTLYDPSFNSDVEGQFLDTILNNKITITITPPGDRSNISYYNVYWDLGTGSLTYDLAHILTSVVEDGQDTYLVSTPEIETGTYKFDVRAVTTSGNESTNSNIQIKSITTYPDPVSNLAVSYNAATQKATFTWNEPSNIGAGTTNIYDNKGDENNRVPDYTELLASVNAGVKTYTTVALADGVWIFGFRVENAAEELNTSKLIELRIESGTRISGYPPKPRLDAKAAAGGTIELTAICVNTSTPAVKVKFFTNDGAGGAVDYDSPIGGDFVLTALEGLVKRIVYTTPAYGATDRIFGCIAYTSDNVPSFKADEATITPDTTIPEQPTFTVAEDR